MNTLTNVRDYTVSRQDLKYYFEDDSNFTADDGLMIAAGITAYDGNSASIEDPSIGELNFYIKSWGPRMAFPTIKLDTHLCTAKDLNNVDGTEEQSYFYKLHEKHKVFVDTYGAKLKCLNDPNQLSIMGNWDSPSAQNLLIVFEPCRNETSSEVVCKSKEYIKEWMSTKFVILVYNTNHFHQHKFGEDTMERESQVTWIRLTPTVQTEFPVQV